MQLCASGKEDVSEAVAPGDIGSGLYEVRAGAALAAHEEEVVEHEAVLLGAQLAAWFGPDAAAQGLGLVVGGLVAQLHGHARLAA